MSDMIARGMAQKNAVQLLDIVTLKPSGSDDTSAWNDAIAKVASGGMIELSHGDYYINGGNLKSNITVRARGKVRILSDVTLFSVNSGSADVANNIYGITFDNINFEAITKTFSEHIHLFRLSGVTSIYFRKCQFIGFRGDGVYLGSGDTGQERHNEDVHFEMCTFDGVNQQNRNGISVIDGDGIYIDKCVFKNCTQPNMPGAIDLEPNTNNWHIVKNVYVTKCKFKNVGGNTGVIGLYVPVAQLNTPVENIIIEGNTIDTTTNSQSAFYLRHVRSAAMDNATLDLNIKISKNRAKNIIARPFSIMGVKGVKILDNSFDSYQQPALIGFTGENDKSIDVQLEDNVFKKGGLTDGRALSLFTVDNVNIIRNVFDDCGKADGSYGHAINFNAGTSSYVRLSGNDFKTPTGVMLKAILKESTHTFNSTTNTDQNNNYNGLSTDFAAGLKNPINQYSVTSYSTTKLPDSFEMGTEASLVNGDTNLPSATKQGTLVTVVPYKNTGYRKFYTQWFYPANNDATTLADMYFRKGNSATNDWSAWKKITGA